MLPVSIWVFIITILIILTFGWNNKSLFTYNRVPKKIWSYWKNPDKLPKTVTMCIESWRKHNPEYEIIIMNKKNFMGYVTIPEEIQSYYYFDTEDSHFSDLLRLYTLAEHGGIWMDPCTIVKKPFDSWLFPKYGEFSGFYNGSVTIQPPVIETCFLACNKHSAFLKQWRDELIQVINYVDITQYITSRNQMGIHSRSHDPLISIAAQKVLQFDKYSTESFQLKNAEEGPFRYLRETTWNSEKGLRLACHDKKYQSPILFLRKEEREEMEKNIDYDLSNAICGWLD